MKVGKIFVNGKEMTEKDITTDTSKPCGLTWVMLNEDGTWTYSKNTPKEKQTLKNRNI